MSNISLDQLFEFVDLAVKSTYAAGQPPLKISERKDFFEYLFTQGDWHYRDSYVGHTKSTGQEIVRFQNEVVWANSYCGGMIAGSEQLADQTFSFLKQALSQTKNNFQSLRGPASFSNDNWSYRYHQEGSIDNFYGYEEILFNNQVVFFHRAIGGTVIIT